MNTKLFLAILLSVSFLGFSQSKKMTKTGDVKFEASVPSFEEVKAQNTTTTVVLNTDNGEIAALALMKGFRFKVALMEEHFNENYIESNKYPKATFKGKIDNFDMSKLSEEEKEFTIKGTLELHGKSKKISAPAKIKKSGDSIYLTSAFSVNSDDFAIEIPAIVSKKVSKKVNIDVDCVLK
ncbi:MULTISPECIES: YceI family protein [Flavobacterium]|uniref:YceI family protein n=1 Tax=Flavobacterium TaxID=237 RepID=UPI001FCB2D2B|nr:MULTISPECIES: YceI family protein [Flavobacterium]UOK42460.1 YceI family protein [Flavobacterium enshiense]